ncbi:MAG: dihydrolipoamide acetyltransferase family protein [Polyangiales bacterium]
MDPRPSPTTTATSSLHFRLPDIGEGVHEGEVVLWHVSPGQTVQEDAPMVEVATDKATVMIAAPITGQVRQLCVPAGQAARVGDVLVILDPLQSHAGAQPSATQADPPTTAQDHGQHAAAMAAGGGAPKTDVSTARQPATVASAVGELRSGLPGVQRFLDLCAGTITAQVEVAERVATAPPPVRATPATRRLARELDVQLDHLPPSSDGGWVTRAQVKAVRAHDRPQPALRTAPGTDTASQAQPLSPLRRRMAQRMQDSLRRAAHFTFVEECSADALVRLRDRLQAQRPADAPPLTYLPLIIKALCQCLKRHPMLNASLDDSSEHLTMHSQCHIGVAAATPAGLLVPVIRAAEHLSVLELSHALHELRAAAAAGTLAPAQLSGSTFTITSLGKRSGLMATPVLNPPEAAILGIHRIRERPVVRQGQVVVGQVMTLSLSLDHRFLDGAQAAAFTYDLIDLLENPFALLLELR